jgi:hypothetical protein
MVRIQSSSKKKREMTHLKKEWINLLGLSKNRESCVRGLSLPFLKWATLQVLERLFVESPYSSRYSCTEELEELSEIQRKVQSRVPLFSAELAQSCLPNSQELEFALLEQCAIIESALARSLIKEKDSSLDLNALAKQYSQRSLIYSRYNKIL